MPQRVAEHVRQHTDAPLPAALLGVHVRQEVARPPAEVREEQELGERQQEQRQVRAQPQPVPAVRPPGQRGQERDADGPREHGQGADPRSGPRPPMPCERERAEREQQEEALGVRQREHEGEREDREVEDGSPRHRLVVAAERDAVEDAERPAEERGREQAAPELHRSREDRERPPRERVEREEGGRVAVADGRVVAVVGDPPVPDGVPLPERAEERVPGDPRLARHAARPRRRGDQRVDGDPAGREHRQRIAVRREPSRAGGLGRPDGHRRRLDGRPGHSGHPRQRQNRRTP